MLERTVFFYGLSKNVGKTTAMKRFLEVKDLKGLVPVLTSIGWDGESVDALFGHLKPRIELSPPAYVVTSERFAENGMQNITFVPSYSDMWSLGRLAIYRVNRRVNVELVGPSRLSELRTLKHILDKLAENLILLIDGAVDRRIGLAIADEVYLVVSPILGSAEKLFEIISLYITLFESKSYSKPDIRLEGGLTYERCTELLKRYKVPLIELDNPSKLIMTPRELLRISDKCRITFRTSPTLKGIVLNTFDAENVEYIPDTALRNLLSKLKPLLQHHNLELFTL